MTSRRGRACCQRVFALLAAAACDPNKALDVKDIDVVSPGQLNDKSALPTLRNGVLSTFQLAFSGGADLANGGHEGQVTMSGLLGDEFLNAESFPDRISRRSARHHPVEPVARFPVSRPEPRARDRPISRPRSTIASTPAPTASRRCSASPGLRTSLFGENYCSGVPFSTLTEQHHRLRRSADPRSGAADRRREIRLGDHHRDGTGRRRPAEPGARRQRACAARSRPVRQCGWCRDRGADDLRSISCAARRTACRQNNGIWNYTANTFAFSVPDREGGNGLTI